MMPRKLKEFELRSNLLGSRLLIKHLGLPTAMSVMTEIVANNLRGDPWRHLPPPSDEKDRLSRRQVGPAILIYKAIRKRKGTDRAKEVVSELILEASILFLSYQIPLLRKAQMLAMNDKERRDLLDEIINRFPNTDIGEIIIEGDECFGYDVTHCRFPELCQAAGTPEIAPMLCAGDKIFIDTRQPDIQLTRTTTIAEGGKVCDFRFGWK